MMSMRRERGQRIQANALNDHLKNLRLSHTGSGPLESSPVFLKQFHIIRVPTLVCVGKKEVLTKHFPLKQFV